MERVVLPLLKAETWVRRKLLEPYLIPVCQRVIFPEIYRDRALKKRDEFEFGVPEYFREHFLIELIDVENSDLTFKVPDVFYDLCCSRLVNGKCVRFTLMLPRHPYKSFDRKCIVLHRDRKLLFSLLRRYERILNKLVLLKDLPGISEEFLPVRRDRDAAVGSKEQCHIQLILQFPDRAGKRRLRNEQALCCLIY